MLRLDVLSHRTSQIKVGCGNSVAELFPVLPLLDLANSSSHPMNTDSAKH